jgi:Icc-related predicted phosphoesterase
VKILAMSDIHCQWDNFVVKDMPAADVVVMAGDITNWGLRQPSEMMNAVMFMEGLARKYKLVLWIPGNHEIAVPPHHFDKSCGYGDIASLYHRTYAFYDGEDEADYLFQGVSCSPCYDMPGLAGAWDYMTANEGKEKAVYESLLPCDILVSHCPPLDCLDNAGYVIGKGSVHIGSRCLREYIEKHQPKLVICGHVHEDGGKEARIGNTRVVNVAGTWQILEV